MIEPVIRPAMPGIFQKNGCKCRQPSIKNGFQICPAQLALFAGKWPIFAAENKAMRPKPLAKTLAQFSLNH